MDECVEIIVTHREEMHAPLTKDGIPFLTLETYENMFCLLTYSLYKTQEHPYMPLSFISSFKVHVSE